MQSETERLKEAAARRGRVAVALSGGLDSSALLALFADALGPGNVLAVSARAPYMIARESALAGRLCERLGVRRLCADFGIPEEIALNPPDRCYRCKLALFSKLKAIASGAGFETLADGTNLDDASDWRPGMAALRELGVWSPFLEVGLGKGAIREIAAKYAPEVALSPACACLMTRFEHGAKIDAQALRAVGRAEELLQDAGFRRVRVRVHGACARVETDPENFGRFMEKRGEISAALKALGFSFAALDIDGYSMGSMNAK